MNPLFQGFDVLRPSEQGGSYASQFGLPLPSHTGGGPGRFDMLQGGALQAGDMAISQGMQPPPPQEGGSWVFSGSNMIGGRGSSGDDDFMAPDKQQSQWTFQPQQQQAAPQQAPQQQQQQGMVDPQLDIYDDWDAYRNRARAQTEGLNRMPFVFGQGSEFVPTNPQSAYQMFYPGNLQGWQDKLRNPLLESDTPPMSMDDVGTSAPGSTSPYLTAPWTNPIFR